MHISHIPYSIDIWIKIFLVIPCRDENTSFISLLLVYFCAILRFYKVCSYVTIRNTDFMLKFLCVSGIVPRSLYRTKAWRSTWYNWQKKKLQRTFIKALMYHNIQYITTLWLNRLNSMNETRSRYPTNTYKALSVENDRLCLNAF